MWFSAKSNLQYFSLNWKSVKLNMSLIKSRLKSDLFTFICNLVEWKSLSTDQMYIEAYWDLFYWLIVTFTSSYFPTEEEYYQNPRDPLHPEVRDEKPPARIRDAPSRRFRGSVEISPIPADSRGEAVNEGGGWLQGLLPRRNDRKISQETQSNVGWSKLGSRKNRLWRTPKIKKKHCSVNLVEKQIYILYNLIRKCLLTF